VRIDSNHRSASDGTDEIDKLDGSSIERHLQELWWRLSIVGLAWIICILAIWPFSSILPNLFERILTVPVFALFLAYPVLCFQTWNFTRPGLKGAGEIIGLIVFMVMIPFVIWGLSTVFGGIENFWVNLYHLHLISEKGILIAKAILVLLIWPIFVAALKLKSWNNKQLIQVKAYHRWLTVLSIVLLALGPAIVSCIILDLFCLLIAALALKHLAVRGIF
jgi:hypothetical protein